MKKYLVFGMSSLMGGVEAFLINYVEQMMDEENVFEFVFFNTVPEVVEKTELKKCKYHVVPSRTRNWFGYYQGLKKIIKEGKYDVLWYNVCTLSDITLLKLAYKYQVPCRIVHSHNSENMGNRIVGILHNIHKKSVSKYATEFFACSEKAADFMFSHKIQNIRIINNAIITEKYKYDKGIRETVRKNLGIKDEMVVGHVGRFHMQKNHFFIMEIFRQLTLLEGACKLMLIGSGELKEQIVEIAKQEQMEESIIFLDNRMDVNELLQAMDVFLFPSLFEGLGLALVEAQAADLPCVISDTIPEAAILSKKVFPMSLESPAIEWAKKIMECAQNNNRSNQVELLREKHYDISENAILLKEYLNSKYI